MAARYMLLATTALLVVGAAHGDAAHDHATTKFDFNKGFSGKAEDQVRS